MDRRIVSEQRTGNKTIDRIIILALFAIDL